MASMVARVGGSGTCGDVRHTNDTRSLVRCLAPQRGQVQVPSLVVAHDHNLSAKLVASLPERDLLTLPQSEGGAGQ